MDIPKKSQPHLASSPCLHGNVPPEHSLLPLLTFTPLCGTMP
jgi:hypothetical protein